MGVISFLFFYVYVHCVWCFVVYPVRYRIVSVSVLLLMYLLSHMYGYYEVIEDRDYELTYASILNSM